MTDQDALWEAFIESETAIEAKNAWHHPENWYTSSECDNLFEEFVELSEEARAEQFFEGSKWDRNW